MGIFKQKTKPENFLIIFFIRSMYRFVMMGQSISNNEGHKTMTIRLSKSILFYSVFVFTAMGSLAFAGLDDGWDALFENHYEEARTAFQETLPIDEERALQGLALLAWAQGDTPELARILSRLTVSYPDSSYTPCYFGIWGSSDLQGWEPAKRIDALKQAMEKELPAPIRQRLAYHLSDMLAMMLDPSCGAYAKESGVLTSQWYIVGPFGQYGAADFFRPFGPETGVRRTYSGFGKEVELHPVTPVSPTGIIEMDGLIYPQTGVSYALNAIESQSEGEAVLTVHSSADYRIWWDGKPVLERTHMKLQTAKTLSVRVPVRKGKILLTVKCQQDDTGWFKIKLQNTADSNLNLTSVAFDPSEFADLYHQPFDTLSPPAESAGKMVSTYPFVLPEAEYANQDIVNEIFLTFWYANRNEFDTAKSHLLNTMKKTPSFAFLQAIYGDLSLLHASNRPGSRSRFQQEGETAFNRALELDPHCKKALVGLVTYYLERRQIDSAREILKTQEEENPELFTKGYTGLLQYAQALLSEHKGFRTDATRQFETLLTGWIPSKEVYRRLFDYYESNNNTIKAAQIISQALNYFPAYLPFLDRASRLDAGTPGAPDAVAWLKKAVALHPYAPRYVYVLGNALERRGLLEDAKALYTDLKDRFPGQPQPIERLASLALAQSDQETAMEAYRALYETTPRWMTPFRALRDIAGENDFPYQKYDSQLEDIEIEKADKWNNSRASSIFLLDIMVLDLHEDGTYDQYIHQAIKILNQEGIRQWAEIDIPAGGHVELIKARTIEPDGTEWAVSNVQRHNGQQSLSMYGVKEGSIVEFAYLERTGNSSPGINYYAGGYFFGTDNDPMVLSKLTLIRPDSITFHLDSNPNDFAPKITRDKNRTVYTWEQWMQDGLKPEAFAPPLSERVPSIQWTTCPDWLPFVERTRMSITEYEEETQAIDDLIAELKQGAASKLDLVRSIYDWVRESIEDGGGGATTADTIALQAGGEYQRMRLAHQLLRKGGVESHLAAALENNEYDGFRPLPFPNYPAESLLIAPVQEGIPNRIILKFESRFAPMNDINPRIRKIIALVFDGPVPYFEPLEPRLWERGLITKEASLVMRDDQSASIDGSYSYSNQYDQQIREILTNPEVEKQLIDRQIVNDLRGIRIEQKSLEDVDDLSKPPRIVFSGVLPDMAKTDGPNQLRIPAVLIPSNASALVNEPTREFPIQFLSSPVNEPLRLRFDLSSYIKEGATIILPPNTLLLTEYGYYSLYYAWEGTDVVVQRSFLIPGQTILPDRYKGFVEFCRTIDQDEKREIRISFPG